MGTSILVVDDDPDILDAVEFTLESEGYIVQTAVDPAKLMPLLGEQHPALLVLDFLMSGVDGASITRQLKAHQATRSMPILMISAHPEAAQVAQECGADGFLAKPFDIDELLETVQQLTIAD
ncbi:response regulator [Dictyobacter kobayashii]|uniref:Response regulatory domain-containing protein n=1 Tax=Dictyobacter kobayashii TaxID=2014872 RepID=A0A402ADZ2_9CHLR|nr:response regulator [Dictyobacter kobayashii]GCE17311.1 hypothetical protein KDK_11110 [Dictyobacter kobayashii]